MLGVDGLRIRLPRLRRESRFHIWGQEGITAGAISMRPLRSCETCNAVRRAYRPPILSPKRNTSAVGTQLRSRSIHYEGRVGINAPSSTAFVTQDRLAFSLPPSVGKPLPLRFTYNTLRLSHSLLNLSRVFEFS